MDSVFRSAQTAGMGLLIVGGTWLGVATKDPGMQVYAAVVTASTGAIVLASTTRVPASVTFVVAAPTTAG